MNRQTTIFSLWTLQGLAAFLWLALLPTDTEHGVLFGFSASRLALIGFVLALTGISAVLTWSSRRSDFSVPDKFHDPLYLLSITVSISAPIVILILHALGKTSGFTYTAYADRLTPLAFWISLSALELACGLFLEKRKEIADSMSPVKPVLRLALYFLIALATLTTFIVITRLGLVPYNDGSWGEPTTPLLEWQILLALIISLVFMTLESRWNWLKQERWTALLIYILTCLLWLSQPVNPGYFATPPRAPNFEIYPFSDALIYAQYVQSALVGNGFLWPDVPTRPLYITFLTWLHAIAGQDYTHIITLQTLVLAAFPAVLYLLGKEIAGRPLGLGLAILATFRDLTANVAAPFALNYTYSKLFFSEIPAALLLCLFTLLAIRWMRQPKPVWYPLMMGGILGLSSLIRLQSVVVLAAVIPIGFFVIGQNRRKWAFGSTLMVLGIALALIPWLARNYKATGGIVLDNPISQSMTLARRWAGPHGFELIQEIPGENNAQFSSRMTGLALQSLKNDPQRIIGSAINHFFNSEIDTLLVFPLRDQLNSPAELIWPEHAFWQAWNSQPTRGQIPIILFYLFLFGVGLAIAWRKNGLLGLLPLGLSLVYNAWTALFLSSGDRFLVPMDWAVYLYLLLGLLTLASLIITGLQGTRENITAWIPDRTDSKAFKEEANSGLWRGLFLTAAIILLFGASIPLTEVAFPQKYSPLPASTASSSITLRGTAIYPRYYNAGEGEPGSAKQGYGESDQSRLVFFLVGESNTLVIFPLDSAPDFFPNISEVVVSGTQEDGLIQAQKITVEKNGKSAEYLP